MKKPLFKNKKIISLLLSILGLTFVFIGGFFASNTQLEKIAEYATDVVKKHTNGKSLCALTVEKTPESGDIADSDFEFHSLYGTFKQQKITFASTINADKRHSIIIENNVSQNVSMLYAGPIGSISYNGHFKHYTLPIEIMFKDEKMYDISRYVAYISESHANRLLEKQNIVKQANGTYSQSDYMSLLKKKITIDIDGVSSIFAIQNIYYQSNYYYEGLHEVMGDFVMTSYWVPDSIQSERQNMYFMSDYTYQNKYFMNYINKAYPSKSYLLKVNRYNIVDEIDETFLTSFYYANIANYEWLFSLFLTFSIILLVLSLLVYYLDSRFDIEALSFAIVRLIVLFIPYSLFSLIYKLSNDVVFLSESSAKANVWMVVGYIMIFTLITLIVHKKKTGTLLIGKEAFCEINI